MNTDDGRLNRVRQMLERNDLAAVITADRENFYYTAGYLPAGHSGASMAVTPVSGPQAMIVSRFEESAARGMSSIDDVRTYLNWVEVHAVEDVRAGTAEAIEKPVQFSRRSIFEVLAELLEERGLTNERLGIELSSLSYTDYQDLHEVLPNVTWVNSKPLMYEVRAVKMPSEISALRAATMLDEIGHQAIVASPRGKTIQELRLDYRATVFEVAKAQEATHSAIDVRSYISAGPRVGPNVLRDSHKVRDGDIIFNDSGVVVDGYASDMGRSYAVGEVDELPKRLHGALLEGYLVGLEMLRPGLPMADLFHAINDTIQRSLPSYVRGHFGHVPGIGFGEQPPFIAPGETAVLEENMVLNIETPYYVKGLGGLQIEDMLLITADGYECFNQLPREMVTV